MAKVIPSKPVFILLYGYPGAGKTYFARQFCEHVQAAHVQGDRIRYELFENPRYDKEENNVIAQLMDYMSEEFLSAGLSVVYDANAMRASQRRMLRDMARKAHAEPILVWFQIDAESAYVRSAKRDRRRADDKYAAPVSRQMFESVAGGMQNPTNVEDYVVISGKHVFSTQLSAVLSHMRERNLIAIDAGGAHVAKPGLVNLVPNPAAGRVDMTRRNIIIR
ncbi:MAG TPA: ATP-binding protein [Candidatus Saccharimonadales bacterium]|nr:ATP-binding protein [Candidatus Saccharimonadales bacterium]